MYRQDFDIVGMTCGSCESKIKSVFSQLKGIEEVHVSKENNKASITSDRKIEPAEIEQLLIQYNGKYQLLGSNVTQISPTWIETYKPILLIFFYLLAITLSVQLVDGNFDGMVWMGHFMAGFFLVFSFFKFLNLSSFADSYQMYDVIAKKFPIWGKVYAFIELGLGFSYLLDFQPFLTNLITFAVMSISIIGVLQAVLNKKRIQCACLGTVFNLPMSTVTIIEDGLMILMAGSMLILL